ncbi:MAG: DUF4238 domain-containing protein [Candidatus Peregrinibacteria bacterium]|nr:DUF4238 domain-containing protein [Candidatus Peregrinibacteria bacterium]
MINEPIEHHYNAVCYLKGFLEAGQCELWIYNKEIEGPPYHKAPKAIMFEDEFYTFIDISDQPNRSVEKELFGLIDRQISPILKKIQELKMDEISGEDYGIIIQFVALQWLRGPKPRAQLEARLKENKLELDKEKIRQIWLLKALPEAEKMINFLFSRSAVFVVSPEDEYFITSDAPCTSEEDITNKNIQRFIPLSSRVGLLIMDHESNSERPKWKQATKEHVEILNERVAKNAVKYIAAKDKKTLEKIISKFTS